MFKVRVRHNKFKGEYVVYEPSDNHTFSAATSSLQIGDWIKDQNNLVTQILGLQYLNSTMLVFTCFGLDAVGKDKDGVFFPYEVNFKRERRHFTRLGKARKTHLSARDRVFLRGVMFGRSLYDSFELAYGRKVDNVHRKAAVTTKFKYLSSSPEYNEVIMSALKDIAKAKGLDEPDFFVEKLMESVSTQVKTDTQMQALAILARAGGNTEVLKMFDLNYDEDPNQLPSHLAHVEELKVGTERSLPQ